jgi:hypothetical protein
LRLKTSRRLTERQSSVHFEKALDLAKTSQLSIEPLRRKRLTTTAFSG